MKSSEYKWIYIYILIQWYIFKIGRIYCRIYWYNLILVFLYTTDKYVYYIYIYTFTYIYIYCLYIYILFIYIYMYYQYKYIPLYMSISLQVVLPAGHRRGLRPAAARAGPRPGRCAPGGTGTGKGTAGWWLKKTVGKMWENDEKTRKNLGKIGEIIWKMMGFEGILRWFRWFYRWFDMIPGLRILKERELGEKKHIRFSQHCMAFSIRSPVNLHDHAT